MKKTNLKLLEESAADDTVLTSVEEVVIQPTPDDDCQDSRADSFQSVSVQTLPIPSIPRGTQTGWYSVSRGVQVFPSGLKTVATQTGNLPTVDFACGTESSPAAKKSSVSQVTDADDTDDVHMSDDEGADPDWTMDEDSETEEEDAELEWEAHNNKRERKFIVFESCLRALLSLCVVCGQGCVATVKQITGTMVTFEQYCSIGHNRICESQPKHDTMPKET
ncbi:uncharacterized protein LOC143235301 [Tachypleus tridentatus]|uniref:uncharacterized protein LOC143235301 n=1 Tax=Tachypleus tridentatus TaxID=6853 RepID=UPI003FD1038F